MSTPFQNRLVGTIIIAAAVVIFLPSLLDGKKKSNQVDFDKIPQAPAFTGKMDEKSFPEHKLAKKDNPTVSNEQAQDDLLKSKSTLLANKKNISKADSQVLKKQSTNNKIKKTEVMPANKVKKIVSNTTLKAKTQSVITKPVLGQQPPKAVNKEAWVIQLGSFKHKSNVAELVTKLKRNGYTVFTKPIKTKQGTLTKVFVGPELIKVSLIKKIPTLKKLTNVQGKIARFYPTK